MSADVAEPRRVLVLSNSVERSGAPVALLRLMAWCAEHGVLAPTFLTRHRGELLDEFRQLGPTYFLSESKEDKIERFVLGQPGGRQAVAAGRWAVNRWARAICRRHRIELVFANTATHSRLVSGLAPLGLPVVTHVHELPLALEGMNATETLTTVIAQSDRLLAVSDAVRQMLVARGAHGNPIVIVPGMLGDVAVLSESERGEIRQRILGAEKAAVVVAACGTPSMVKGTDVFLSVARSALSMLSDDEHGRLVFRWIGGFQGSEAGRALVHDVARLGLKHEVALIPRIERADRALAAADLFLSPSREDANPLSAMEAAAAGCAMICFRGAGGAEEFADVGGARAVPYLNAEAMAAAVVELFRSPADRQGLSETGSRLAFSRHSPDVLGSRVAEVIHGLA
jgi:glycosyltransferase involved in cell wall biosynthesis